MSNDDKDKKSSKLWGGRFSADMADIALHYSESTQADAEMIAEDIWGSQPAQDTPGPPQD